MIAPHCVSPQSCSGSLQVRVIALIMEINDVLMVVCDFPIGQRNVKLLTLPMMIDSCDSSTANHPLLTAIAECMQFKRFCAFCC